MNMYSTHILKQVRKQRILHEVTLELTYKCNLDCFFCYNDRQKQGQILSFDQYSLLLHDLAQMQTLHIMLTGGEPMVHPHFFEIGSLAKELGFVTRVRTNGHSLTVSNVKRLKEEVDPFYLEVSLHGATAVTHEKQTRITGSFDKLIKGIKNCHDQGLDVRAVSTPTAWNEHELPEMFDLCDSLGLPLRFQGPVAPRDNGDLTPLQISPKKSTWDEVEALVIARTKGDFLEVESPMTKSVEIKVDSIGVAIEEPKAMCGVGVASVDIDPYGNVQACMHLQQTAGSLHDTSIKDIWGHSPLFLKARNRSIEIAKRFEDKQPRQLGAHIYCLAVEENLQKGIQQQGVSQLNSSVQELLNEQEPSGCSPNCGSQD